MDVIFVLEDEPAFCIRLEFFDTFQEIKEKIKKLRNIPVDRQTLLFNGQVLPNEAFIIDTDISQLSWVQILVQPNENEYDLPQWIRNASKLDIHDMQEMLSSIREPQNMSFTVDQPMDPSVVLTENPDELAKVVSSMMDAPPEEPVPKTVTFTLISMDTRRKPLTMQMKLDDTVLQLKKVFMRMKRPRSLEVKDMVVVNKVGDELHDHMSMVACGMLNMSHVYLCKRSDKGVLDVDLKLGKMLKVMVVPKGGTKKIPIEVNSFTCLGDLRFELEKFHKHVLPKSAAYFFTREEGPLPSEIFSFCNIGIKEGDTIVINPKHLC